jgi:hypothetical protein
MITKTIPPSNASPPDVPHPKILFAISKMTHTRRPETGCLSTSAHSGMIRLGPFELRSRQLRIRLATSRSSDSERRRDCNIFRIDLSECEVRRWKMNVQLIANEEDQDCAQGGKNQAGGMILLVCRARKHVRNGAPKDRSDNAQHDCPEDCYVHVHHRFRDNPRDQPNKNIPN